jgi:hypothetical protein
MGIGDVLAAYPASLLRFSVGVRKSNGRRKQMTTESMEAYSLEVGDQIAVNGEVFRIVDIEDGDNLDYRFVLVDEEGYRRHIEAEFQKKFEIVLDNLSAI